METSTNVATDFIGHRRTRSVTKETTKTDPDAIARSVEDEPMQLRVWGTERTYPLPPRSTREFLIGASPDCWIRLRDQECYVSRTHAALELVDAAWRIVDKDSKNGVRVDGVRADRATLAGGTEIGLGRITLVVETPRTMRVRALLARLLGWDESRRVIVDRALRVARAFAAGTMPMVLVGHDDLPVIARMIHVAARGETRSFEVIEDEEAPRLAITQQTDGTLCVRRPTPNQAHLTLSEPNHVITCASESDQSTAIRIPPIADRPDVEAERLVLEYAIDALVELNAKGDCFPPVDHDWVIAHVPATHGDLQTVTRRLVAIRALGGITAAADYLQISPSALSRWYSRRMRRRWRS